MVSPATREGPDGRFNNRSISLDPNHAQSHKTVHAYIIHEYLACAPNEAQEVSEKMNDTSIEVGAGFVSTLRHYADIITKTLLKRIKIIANVPHLWYADHSVSPDLSFIVLTFN